MTEIILLNAAGCFFLAYLTVRAISIARARKQCQPIHKRPFQVKPATSSWKDRLTIIAAIVLWGLWLLGIVFYDTIQLSLLYVAGLLGITTFFPFFRHGKLGHKGIAIADQLISWQDIDDIAFAWLKAADFHYPNGKLSFQTFDGQSFSIIIDKKDAAAIQHLLDGIRRQHTHSQPIDN